MKGLEEAAEPPLRVYLLGAHSTGKTTLARRIADVFGLTIVTEVARTVLAESSTTLPALRIDLDRTKAYQMEVAKRQVIAENVAGPRFVSDRACDNLAYAALHTTALREILQELDVEKYMQRLRGPHAAVFFVRPHPSLVKVDGTRTVDWDEILQLDGMIRWLLEAHDVNYVSLSTPSMVDRWRTVLAVLETRR